MLNEDPQDPFLNYALAMELDKAERHEESLALFRQLTEEHEPPYVPAFFMAGQMLARLDRIPEAKEFLHAGILQAQNQGDAHAAGEMTEFMEMLDG